MHCDMFVCSEKSWGSMYVCVLLLPVPSGINRFECTHEVSVSKLFLVDYSVQGWVVRSFHCLKSLSYVTQQVNVIGVSVKMKIL